MGATVNMTKFESTVHSSLDCVVIRKNNACIIGGRTLDMTGFPKDEDCIKSGHVIIRSTEDETLYKPMPVSGKAYSSLPHNFEYVGVVVSTVPVSDPRVGIMYDGEVNDKACPYPVDGIKEALKTALPGLVFMHD